MKQQISAPIWKFIQRAESFGWVNTETNSRGMKFKRDHRPKQHYGWSASRKQH